MTKSNPTINFDSLISCLQHDSCIAKGIMLKAPGRRIKKPIGMTNIKGNINIQNFLIKCHNISSNKRSSILILTRSENILKPIIATNTLLN